MVDVDSRRPSSSSSRDRERDREKDRYDRERDRHERDRHDRDRSYGRREERPSSHSSYNRHHSSHSYEKDSYRREKRRDSPSRDDRRENSKKHRSNGNDKEEKVSVEDTKPSETENPEDYQKRVAEQLEQMQQQPTNEEELREERKRKREAILAKYKLDSVENKDSIENKDSNQVMEVEEVINSTHTGSEPASPIASPQEELTVPEPAKLEDSETADLFDMFNDSPMGLAAPRAAVKDASPSSSQHTLIETDAEGFVELPPGTVLSDRYQINSRLGSGVFSKVFKAKDLVDNKEVAVKVIRHNEAMKRVGVKEVELLQLIASRDPEDKFCCARLLTHFEDRDLLCLVFQLEGDDLLDVIKKFGRGVGLSIKAVQVYAKQLFRALFHLRRLGLIHADIKPTNILVNDNRTRLRLSDLGSAHTIKEVEPTPCLVTGWFRAPEIILGMPYSYAIDMWSVACTLFEIATGKVLFRGNTNNEMLRMHLAAKGRDTLSKKMLKRAMFWREYFDDNLNFQERKIDPVTGREYIHPLSVSEPTRDLKAELLAGQHKEDIPQVLQLYDLLQKALTLDPSKRLSVEEALKHPFIA